MEMLLSNIQNYVKKTKLSEKASRERIYYENTYKNLRLIILISCSLQLGRQPQSSTVVRHGCMIVVCGNTISALSKHDMPS